MYCVRLRKRCVLVSVSMLQLRSRPRSARFAFFGLGLCSFALTPTEIGYQDIGSLLARQPGVAERWHRSMLPAAGSIQLATYSFGRPIGTSAPQVATYRLASLDNRGIDITGAVRRNPIAQTPPRYQASDFPKVDRTLKGDRLRPPMQRRRSRSLRKRIRRSRPPRPPMHRRPRVLSRSIRNSPRP
jgi:hypothetical protein